jgi:hypothetical protein
MNSAKTILNSPLEIGFDKTLIDDENRNLMSFENIYVRNQWICITSFHVNTVNPILVER